MVQLLLDHRVNVNTRGHEYGYPLQAACRITFFKTVAQYKDVLDTVRAFLDASSVEFGADEYQCPLAVVMIPYHTLAPHSNRSLQVKLVSLLLQRHHSSSRSHKGRRARFL